MDNQYFLCTGGAGGVGLNATKTFLEKTELSAITIDNNFREKLFGKDGNVSKHFDFLKEKSDFYDFDIRNEKKLENVFKQYGSEIKLIIHAAAQPSHNWASQNPVLDFDINTRATIILLELTRKYCPEAVFIYMSSNKVYGDSVNLIPYQKVGERFEFIDEHFKVGIDEQCTIDYSDHSFMGAAKVASDVYVQEYGRYFHMPTVCFRGGCLTGVDHAGAQAHGFLNYIIKCAVENRHYNVIGFDGYQVRDNLHFSDLSLAFLSFFNNPKCGAIYNMGGGYENSISVREVISYLRDKHNFNLEFSTDNSERFSDHRVYYSDLTRFKTDFPSWRVQYNVHQIIDLIVNQMREKQNG